MDLGIRGKVAVVAASSRGLGKAAAFGFAREGARVVICAREQDRLSTVRDKIKAATNADVLAVQVDLTRPNDIKHLIDQTVESFGTVDILVNNAGGPNAGFFSEMTDEQWQQGIELTLMSSVRLTREVLPFMQKQKWGRIINITSVSVKQPIDELLLSNSLRLSILGWAKTLSNQVAADGILINNVCPGWTRTQRVIEIFAARAEALQTSPEDIEKSITSTIPMNRLATPEEQANLIVFLGSERASYITGTTIQVDGGAVRGIY